MKTLFIIGTTMLLLVSAKVHAHDHHHDTKSETINVNSGIALGIAASQIYADWSTQKTQLGIGTGMYKDDNAIAVGLGKRFNKVLINGSISTNGNDTAFGAGLNFRF